MLKAGVGWSTLADPAEAGTQSAQQALSRLAGQAGLAVVFCTVGYDAAKFVGGARAALGPVPLIGATSFTGVITPGGFVHADTGSGAVMVLGGEGARFGVGGATIGADPVAAGAAAARAAIAQAGNPPTPPTACFIVAPPGAEERLIAGVESVVGRVPMMGGSAADNTLEGKWLEFANAQIMSSGVAVALIYSPEPVAVDYRGHYTPTDKRGIITKVRDRRTLVEIDGKPALDVYAGWRGLSRSDLLGGNLLVQTITNPLGIRDVSGELWWIRHPMHGNDDGSMAIGNDLAEGTVVTMMSGDFEQIAAGAPAAVQSAVADLGAKPSAVLIAHCGGRALGLGPERMQGVAESIRGVLGDVPFLGYCTFGEQGFSKWTANGAGGLMLSVMALA